MKTLFFATALSLFALSTQAQTTQVAYQAVADHQSTAKIYTNKDRAEQVHDYDHTARTGKPAIKEAEQVHDYDHTARTGKPAIKEAEQVHDYDHTARTGKPAIKEAEQVHDYDHPTAIFPDKDKAEQVHDYDHTARTGKPEIKEAEQVHDYDHPTAIFPDKDKAEQVHAYNHTARTGMAEGEASTDIDVQVWPNPTTDYINIARTHTDQPAYIMLTDMQGRTMFSQNSNQAQTTIDVTRFATGTYRLMVVSGSQRTSKAIIVR